jgi:hypothetical protein
MITKTNFIDCHSQISSMASVSFIEVSKNQTARNSDLSTRVLPMNPFSSMQRRAFYREMVSLFKNVGVISDKNLDDFFQVKQTKSRY